MNIWARRLRAIVHQVRRLVRGNNQSFQPWSEGGSPRILFGCGADGAPLRYRVQNQGEQLALQQIAYAYYGDEDTNLAKQANVCDLLYLYRARNTPMVRRAISTARTRAIPVLYDTDDLTWDVRLIDYCAMEHYYDAADLAWFRGFVGETDALMRQADAFITSTAFLADLIAAHFGKPAYVNENAISLRDVELSTPHFERHMAASPAEHVTIAYFSGWPRAHEIDLAVALPAILRVLNDLPSARLRIVGHFDIGRLPEALQAQVETVPFVPWEQLFETIAAVDINLAPIVNNPHRRGKSAIKFLEAALVGVPSVASDLEPYAGIAHGRSGFLAGDSDSWYSSIMALATDPQLRQTVGRAAREQVLARDTTAVRAEQFARLLMRMAN